jgi:hypothetical protein
LNQGNSLRTLQFTHCCDIFELAYETQWIVSVVSSVVYRF